MADTGGNRKERDAGSPARGARISEPDGSRARGGAAVRGLCLAVDCEATASSLSRCPAGTPRDCCLNCLRPAEFRGQVDWAKVHVFWSDERAVPPDHPDSNYGMARRELLIRVPIPQANVHRMEAEKPNIGRAAHEYEEVLRKYLELDDRGFPRFHLIFLGMGADGHTASLFPGTRVTRQTSRWVSTPMVCEAQCPPHDADPARA